VFSKGYSSAVVCGERLVDVTFDEARLACAEIPNHEDLKEMFSHCLLLTIVFGHLEILEQHNCIAMHQQVNHCIAMHQQ